jgi:hypothetical protein
VEVNMDTKEILQRFEANHRRFLGKVMQCPAEAGSRLLAAGQQVEIEAYSEVFGETYTVLYKGITAGGLDLSFLEMVRAGVKEEPLNEILEEFKSGFKEVLTELAELPFFEAVSITAEARRVEVRLVGDFTAPKERQYALAFRPVEKSCFTAPDGWHILGYVRTRTGEWVVGFKEVTEPT